MNLDQARDFIVGRVLPMQREIDTIIAKASKSKPVRVSYYWKIEAGGNSYPHATVNKWVSFGRSLHLGGGMMMTLSRARKPYRCEWCGGRIEPGEEYARFRTVRVYDGMVPAHVTSFRHVHHFTPGLQVVTSNDGGH